MNTTLQRIALLAAAMHAYDRTHAVTVCDNCGATWETTEDDTCQWCTTALDNQRRWQAELILHPPDDINPDNPADDGALTGWAERLHRAVQSGLVTEHQAETAIRQLQLDVA